jgi:hypothetical protein
VSVTLDVLLPLALPVPEVPAVEPVEPVEPVELLEEPVVLPAVEPVVGAPALLLDPPLA